MKLRLIINYFHLDFFFFLLSSSELLLLSLSLLSESEEESEDEESLSLLTFAWASNSAYFFSRRRVGAFLRNSLKSSVIAPRPILVKKLMENLALLTESFGKTPSKWGTTLSSFNFVFSYSIPRFSASS